MPVMGDKKEWPLVKEAIGGSHVAFMELMRLYDWVVSAEIWRVSDLDMQDDIRQESLLRAWRYRGSCNKPEKFGGWFRNVVRGARNNYMSRVVKRWPEPIDKKTEQGLSYSDDSELGVAVEIAASSLKPMRADAVRLVYVCGLSLRQAANELGITYAAIHGRLSKAYPSLRRALSEFMPEGRDEE